MFISSAAAIAGIVIVALMLEGTIPVTVDDAWLWSLIALFSVSLFVGRGEVERVRGQRRHGPGAPWTAGPKRKGPGSGLFSTPGYPGSIVSAEAFHFRVRDGNGWFHLALATRSLDRDADGGWRTPTPDRL